MGTLEAVMFKYGSVLEINTHIVVFCSDGIIRNLDPDQGCGLKWVDNKMLLDLCRPILKASIYIGQELVIDATGRWSTAVWTTMCKSIAYAEERVREENFESV